MFFHRGNAKFSVLQGERDLDLFKSFSVKKILGCVVGAVENKAIHCRLRL
jgi:hypothetical protein